MKERLDAFGAFFVQNLRDKMLNYLDHILSGASKAPDVQELQRKATSLGDAEKQLVYELVDEIITTGMHDLLFAIQEESDAGGAIKVLVNGGDVAKDSDGLHGEIFGDTGWIVRFSKYPAKAEIERSQWAKEQIKKLLGEKKKDGT